MPKEKKPTGDELIFSNIANALFDEIEDAMTRHTRQIINSDLPMHPWKEEMCLIAAYILATAACNATDASRDDLIAKIVATCHDIIKDETLVKVMKKGG